MIETRAKIHSVVSNQIPEFVQNDAPLFGEFLEQYYKSQEFQGGPIDLAENLDQYIKNDSFRQQYLVTSTNLDGAIDAFAKTIAVNSTTGFPDRYGYLKVDDEIISYTSKDKRQFFGCVRAFSAITSLFSSEPDRVTFGTSSSASHKDDATVTNLSNLFLAEFFKKYKQLYVPGLEDRSFVTGLDQALFAKQAKDLYKTKGTDDSFEILFRALYGSKAVVIKPFEQTIKPSDADYRITEDLVVVALDGDPYKLKGQTLYQDEVSGILQSSYGSIDNVIKYTRSGNSYYQISIDVGANKDISERGSIYGKFDVTPTTRTVTEEVSGVNTLYVDSTVGFPDSGTLIITVGSVDYTVTYTSTTTTQFLGVSGNSATITKNSLVRLSSSIYGYDVDGNKIKVRITGVVSKFMIPGPTKQMVSGDLIDVQNLGALKDKDKTFTEWVYNVTNLFNIETIEDIGNGNHKITCPEVHLLHSGDLLTLINQTTYTEHSATVVDLPSSKIAILSGLGSVDLDRQFKARKELIRAEVLPAVKQPEYKFSANVTNAYDLNVVGIVSGSPYAGPYHTHMGKKMVGAQHVAGPHDFIEGESKNETYISSPSIPYYFNQQLNADLRGIDIKVAATFAGETISTTRSHDFKTGDEVYYIPGTTESSTLIDGVVSTSTTTLPLSPLTEGSYFAYKVDDKSFKLAYSRANIDSAKFIDLTGNSAGVTTHTFASNLKNKAIDSQRLVRRFSKPLFDSSDDEYTTLPGEKLGMFVNGVELANYKSRNAIYYGELTEVNILEGGSGHDVINPPALLITDNTGVGATGHVNVKGSFERIDVSYPGFDYLNTPQINISGGNGIGAKAEVKMKQKSHSAYLDVAVGVDTATNNIGFTTYHLFNDGDRIFYRQNKGTSVGVGTTVLGDGAIYFVEVVDNTNIRLHSDYGEAIAGTNTIDLTDKGSGTQYFETVEKKNIVDKIFITNPGTGYENKKRTVIPTGVSTANHTINIKDHGYKDGEIITYSTTGTEITDLTSSAQYRALVVDNDHFRLAQAGVGGTLTTDYDNGTYVKFTGVGLGTHIFNYQPISVAIEGDIGISSALGEASGKYKATLIPVVRGAITYIDLTQNGSGYGNSAIVNYNRQPNIDFLSGSGAELRPIVKDGAIDQVIVTRGGSGYNSPPEIITSGIGTYATLTPVISDGVITSVNIVNGGVGFVTDRSFLSVETAKDAVGRAPVVDPRVARWELDNVNRYRSLIKLDDGFMEVSDADYGSQFTHLYAPRQLRKMLPSLKLSGDKDYGSYDLEYENAEEVSENHSPILGFAYDGNPIYGPYGFAAIGGGIIRRMIPGYELNATRSLGPSVGDWPLGSFTGDYTFTNKGDLDKHNGRFCKTPDYPEGTYAYFATIDSSSQQDATFDKYFTPVFPYVIGETFKSKPDKFNFSADSNSDKINLNKGGYVRNIYPYKLSFEESDYEFVARPDKIVDDFASITYADSGRVESIFIEDGGYDYKVGDKLVFDNSATGGINAAAKVVKIEGKDLVKVSASIEKKENVTFEVLENKTQIEARTQSPHNFKNGDYVSVSGMSSQSIINLDGIYNIGVTTETFKLATGIGSTGTTGIITYIPINGNVNVLRENDVIGISTEELQVLNIDVANSRIRVLREYNVGAANTTATGTAHTQGSLIEEKPRSLTISVGIKTDSEIKLQRSVYFDPSEVVGLGTTSGVGITSTISITTPGLGVTDIAIPRRTIYLPDHGFDTGDSLTYSNGSGTSLTVSDEGINTFTLPSNVYAISVSKNLVGLSTLPVGMGSFGTFVGVGTTAYQLYLHSVGAGVTHDLTTTDTQLTGILEKVVVTSTATTAHGLGVGDTVFMNVFPGITTTYSVKYNEYNRNAVVGLATFLQDNVNTSTNVITIVNHGLQTGDKVIYDTTSTVSGLTTNGVYYIIKNSDDSIKLAVNYYNATTQYPVSISLGSTGGAVTHSLYPINPFIEVTRGQKLELNVDDSSLGNVSAGTTYSAFSIDFYEDRNFRHKFLTRTPDSFDVSTSGDVGITGGRVYLQTNTKTPNILYYKLTPVNPDRITTVQSEIITDKTVPNYSTIKLKDSLYNGNYTIASIGGTTFSFNVPNEPETASYTLTDATMSYETNSPGALGAISDIKVTNKGNRYYSIPGISTVTRKYTGTAATTYGNGSILRVESDSIGYVKTTQIDNPGYEFPYDQTLRPTGALPSLFKVDRFRTLDHIGLSSGGSNYSVAPKCIVKDRVSGLILDECEIETEISGSVGVSSVKIIKNTKRLQDPDPKIIPIHNSNGVGIQTVGFTTTTAVVELTLDTDFSTGQDFPFAVGDKVLVEGVGIATTGFGYNSSEYNYNLFTLNSVTPNIGGADPKISFVLENDNPGEFNPSKSAGRVIPEKHFPGFVPVTKKGNFDIKEKITQETLTGTKTGTVIGWNENNNTLRIATSDKFVTGKQIEGAASNQVANVQSIESFDSTFDVGPLVQQKKGFQEITGFLNDSRQRVHDNNYYQAFAYSVKSPVQFSTWKDVVGEMTHTSGFKKFSDMELESFAGRPDNADEQGDSSYGNGGTGFPIAGYGGGAVSGTPVSQEVSVKADLISVTSVDTKMDFDNATELTVEVAGVSTANQITISKDIVLENKVLTDYEEARTNRVISIDDPGELFASTPRTDPFQTFDSVRKGRFTTQRYFYHIKDTRYVGENQTGIFNILNDGTNSWITQYSMDTQGYLGSFDYAFSGAYANVNFYPLKYELNNYVIDFVSLDFNKMTGIQTGGDVGTGSTNIGDLVSVSGFTTITAVGAATTILGISTTASAGNKVIVEITQTTDGISTHQFSEVSIVHDRTGNDSGTGFFDFGSFSSGGDGAGIGTLDVTTNKGVNLNFYPNAGVSTNCAVKIVNTELSASATGIGSTTMLETMMESFYTTISSSATPGQNKICGFTSTEYEGAYFFVGIEDTTNSKQLVQEYFLSHASDGIESQSYYTDWAEVLTTSGTGGMVATGLGTVGAGFSGGDFCLYYTPSANIATKVRVFGQALENKRTSVGITTIGIGNAKSVGQFRTGEGTYTGTLAVVKRNFNLTHRNRPIFRKVWDAELDTGVVDLTANTIQFADHFLVTGEELKYEYDGTGIQTSGGVIGTTVYAVKVSEDLIKLSPTASDSLTTPPTVLDFSAVGTGNSHAIASKKADTKALIALDNNIQSPIVSTGITVGLVSTMNASQVAAQITGIGSMVGGDIIKIDDEYMRVKSTGYILTDQLLVDRGWLGSDLGVHTASTSSPAVVTKFEGNYTILGNSLNFVEPPYGKEGYAGLQTRSTFQGRVFLRQAESDDSVAYEDNLVFDSLSKDFTGIGKTFTITTDGSNVTGFSTNNGVFLLNEIFQGPTKDYTLSEGATKTEISFTGTGSSVTADLNVGDLPRGGVIVTVGSSEGMGYQPLVAAGGTANVSGLGTISSISIGNSGSGYRIGIQTVYVGVGTSGAAGYPNIVSIGTAVVENGYIVSIGVTNGVAAGYTFTNPPKVYIDAPIGYENIPLVAAGGSTTNGVNATADVKVGLGNSVTLFSVKNTGRNYEIGDVLTVQSGGTTGIPTTGTPANFKDFQVIIEAVHNDKFAGWTFGLLDVLDDFSSNFDGVRKSFTVSKAGNVLSLRSAKGSPIRIQDNLIIFINDILQDPGVSFEFKGGSVIDFFEAPKAGDTLKIYYFKGSATDSIFVDTIETIKEGDKIRLRDDSTKSSTFGLDQNTRLVSGISTSDTFRTVQYFGPGITTDTALQRSMTWQKQKDDIVVDGVYVSKARIINQSTITPTTRIIQNVGIASTTIYVQSIRPLFNDTQEAYTGADLNLSIIDEDSPKVSAGVTAIVSDTGTISLSLNSTGLGYTAAPAVSISTYPGVTTRATATATVSAAGTVTGLTVSDAGVGYTNTTVPLVLLSQPIGLADTLGTPAITGDFGYITGVAATTVGSATTGLVFDIMIDDTMRDPVRVGTAVTVTQIEAGDFFYVNNTNTGLGLTSYEDADGTSIVGVGTSFMNNIFRAQAVGYAVTDVPGGISTYIGVTSALGTGVGATTLIQVTVSVSSTENISFGSSAFYGEYSFGKLTGVTRDGSPGAFSIVNTDGITGLSTAPIIRRLKNIKRSY